MSYLANRPTGTVSASRQATFSIPSIIAIICAVVALFFSTGFGFLLAMIAIVLGLVGAVMALSPNVRGGIISMLSVAAGLLAAVVSVFRFVL